MPPSVRSRQSKKSDTAPGIGWGWFVLLAAAVVVPYLNSLDNPFVWDDSSAIVNNQTIRSIWPPWTPLQPPANTPVSSRPLVNLTFAVNYSLHGLDVRGYHIANLGLHLLTAWLLFALVHRTLQAGRARAGETSARSPAAALTALLATLLWAVHPMLNEVVNYTTQRSDALGGLFLMTTLLAAQRALDSSHRTRWSVIAVAACACGMLSKEFVAVTPLIVLLYDRAFAFGSYREAFVARKRLYGALAATWIPLAAILVLRPHPTIGFAAGVSAWTYALNQAEIIVHYLRLAVWPDALVADYGVPRPVSLGDVWTSVAVIATLVTASIVALFRWPRAGFLCAVFFLLLAPTSSVVPIVTEVGAERRMYLALAALTILLAAGGAEAIDRVRRKLPHRAGRLIPAAVVLAGFACAGTLGLLTARRNGEFASPLTLWRSSIERWPQGRARIMYAAALSDAGDHDSAIGQLRLAVDEFPAARSTLGRELMLIGRRDEAVRELSAFVAAEPSAENRLPARMLIADIFRATGRVDEAAGEYRRIVGRFPSNAAARERLAGLLLSRGDSAEAAAHYEELVRQYPDNVGWRISFARALAFSRRWMPLPPSTGTH